MERNGRDVSDRFFYRFIKEKSASADKFLSCPIVLIYRDLCVIGERAF